MDKEMWKEEVKYIKLVKEYKEYAKIVIFLRFQGNI